jgi:non-heme chloroperoxidase
MSDRIANSGLLSAKLVKGAALNIYKGAPHGLCTTHTDQINEELLAFIKSAAQTVRAKPAREAA